MPAIAASAPDMRSADAPSSQNSCGASEAMGEGTVAARLGYGWLAASRGGNDAWVPARAMPILATCAGFNQSAQMNLRTCMHREENDICARL
eukprot:1034618-Pyramimonas_sp.AAC.1